MTVLAIVDELRALPLPLAVAALDELEAALGPEALAALHADFAFYARPAQRFPADDERPAILLIVGEYGTGKTWLATRYFEHLVLTGQAAPARIITATGADISGTIIDGPSGMRSWLPYGTRFEYRSSKGHEGEAWINGVKIACLSADAPGQAIGEGCRVQLLDDVAKWIITCGMDGAKRAWAASQKSCREPGSMSIVPTTPDGIAFILELMDEKERHGIQVIDLGDAENNRGNLSKNFLEHVIPALKEQGLWNPLGSPSPFAKTDFASLRLAECPPLVEIGIAIDPNKAGTTRPCEAGVVGGGRDERSAVHVRHDRSAVLDAGMNGWPKAAWDLAVDMQREHPGVQWHFVLETNVGKSQQEHLRGEERARRLRGEPVPLPGGGWANGKSEVSVCEIRLIRADKDKCRRADSPARLAEQRQVFFAPALGRLEGQLRDLTPAGTKSDRADAAVHLVNDIAGLGKQGQSPLVAEDVERDEDWGERSRYADDFGPEDRGYR